MLALPETQQHICHLTVLNPAIHSRIFFKEARTQVRAGYSVTVIGQSEKKSPFEQDGVKIVPIRPFSRLSVHRILFARMQLFAFALRAKADIYVLHAPELLGLALLLKLTGKCKVIYDVHEDYYLNIRYADYFPAFMTGILAHLVKWHEQFYTSFCDGMVYAEKCFKINPWFGETPSVVVENKFSGEISATFLAQIPVLLFTGTIAENWGIWESLNLWKDLNQGREVHLRVVGHTHNLDLLKEIDDFVASSGFESRFQLIGGKEYVPHEQILAEIANCSLGLAFYQMKKNIKDRIPTKFYEFMALQKPLLFTSNPPWNELNIDYNFGIALDGKTKNKWAAAVQPLLDDSTDRFYRKPLPDSVWSWKPEGEKMLGFIQSIGSKSSG